MIVRVALAVVLVIGNAMAYAADPVCYQYRVGSSAAWESTKEAARDAFFASCNSSQAVRAACAGNPYAGYAGVTCTWTFSSFEGLQLYYFWHCERGAPFDDEMDGWDSKTVAERVNPEGCPPDSCAADAGKKTTTGGVGTSVPSTACVNMCEHVASGVGVAIGNQWASQMTATGNTGSCGEGGATSANSPNCVSSPSGMFCASKSERNCGTVNGEKVCLNAVPPGQCQFMGDGGMVCASDAGNPPGPSDSEGAPATPDQVLNLSGGAGGTVNYNYYTSTTVAGSSTGASGSAPGGAGSSTGDDDDFEDPEDGGDVGDAGEICDGADCYGDVPAEVAECAENQEACASGIVGSRWSSITTAVPLLGFAAGLDDALASEGACPSVHLEFFGQEHEVMGPVCGVLEQNETLLALVWGIGWALVGFRILLKAE